MTAPRLLAGVSDVPMSLDTHLRHHGPLPHVSGQQVVDVAQRIALRGRGGAGFPVARKLTTTRDAGRLTRRAVVVANGSEGEPASLKDRTLLRGNPHLVLDGVQLAARATGATRAAVCVHQGELADVVRSAVAERRDTVVPDVVEVNPRYVAGEASALVRRLGGGPGIPSTRRVPLAERGLSGRPTLVSNVESLAQLAVAVRLGVEEFRAVGDPAEPGTLLLTVRGAVATPRVVEVATGTPIRTAVELAGSAPLGVQALLVGGYYGRWLPPDALDVPLTREALRQAGGTLGAGLLVVLPPSACGLAASADVARYLAQQSAGQCGPCRNGLPAIAAALADLAAGRAGAHLTEQLQRWCGLVRGRGACSHPDGASAFVSSALTVFSDDVERHVAGHCGRAAATWTGLP